MPLPLASAAPGLAPPTHLILVCCHAIYVGQGATRGVSPSEWLLSAFQRDEEVTTFTQHVQLGLQQLVDTWPTSLLVFSGAATRGEVCRSEARGYLDLAVENGFWGIGGGGGGGGGEGKDGPPGIIDIKSRIVLEERALDSLHNLIFSMVAFWRFTGEMCWPGRMTVVSHGFKRERFERLHARAVRWSLDRLVFCGLDPGYMVQGQGGYDEGRAEEVREGERWRGRGVWKEDLWGLGEGERGLRRKRWERNYWRVGQEFFESEGERRRSGVRSRILEAHGDVVEEGLLDERQPWE